MMNFPLKQTGYVRFDCVVTLQSGTLVGGNDPPLAVGDIDKTFIKDPLTSDPYIPGSSFKGKLRNLLERKIGRFGANGDGTRTRRDQGQERREKDGNPCGCGQLSCLVCRIFGPHANTNHSLGPARILVRDAFLTEDSKRLLDERKKAGISVSEAKIETAVSRQTGQADAGLRTAERTLRELDFNLQIVLRVFDKDDKEEMVNFIKAGIEQIAKNEGIGGSSNRGYGQIAITYNVVDPA